MPNAKSKTNANSSSKPAANTDKPPQGAPSALPEELDKILQQTSNRDKDLPEADQRKIYQRTKELLVGFEKTNLRYIVLYHRNSKWWHLGDNSMLIYVHMLARSMGYATVGIQADTDYTKIKWKYGCAAIGNVRVFTYRLGKAGCKPVLDSAELKVYALPRPLSQNDMRAFQYSREEKIKRFNSMVVPAHRGYAKLMQTAAMLDREVTQRAIKLPSNKFELLGAPGARLTSWISLYSIHMVNGHYDEYQYLIEARTKLDELNDWLAYIRKYDIYNIDTMARIYDHIVEFKKVLAGAISQLEKKHPELVSGTESADDGPGVSAVPGTDSADEQEEKQDGQ